MLFSFAIRKIPYVSFQGVVKGLHAQALFPVLPRRWGVWAEISPLSIWVTSAKAQEEGDWLCSCALDGEAKRSSEYRIAKGGATLVRLEAPWATLGPAGDKGLGMST